MSSNLTTNNNINQNEINSASEYVISGLQGFPFELNGIMPENVWVMLTDDQKKEILLQHGLFKYLVKGTASGSGNIIQPDISVSPDQTNINSINSNLNGNQIPEVVSVQNQQIDPQISELKSNFEQIKNEVRASEQALLQSEKQPSGDVEKARLRINQDEKARIDAEKAANANQKAMKVFGYTPSQIVQQNATQISDSGDPMDSKTWAATLLKKMMAMFG